MYSTIHRAKQKALICAFVFCCFSFLSDSAAQFICTMSEIFTSCCFYLRFLFLLEIILIKMLFENDLLVKYRICSN